jgi:hypothetical protein
MNLISAFKRLRLSNLAVTDQAGKLMIILLWLAIAGLFGLILSLSNLSDSV